LLYVTDRVGKDPQPAISDLFVGPARDCVRIDTEHDMGVIAHSLNGTSLALLCYAKPNKLRCLRYRIREDRNSKRPCQKMNSLLDPRAPVIEVLAGALIRAAEESAVNAHGHDMKTAVFSGRRDL